MNKLYYVLSFLLVNCTIIAQVPQLDSKTGYFKGSKRGQTIESIPVSKDSLKNLIVAPNGEVIEGMTKNFKFL